MNTDDEAAPTCRRAPEPPVRVRSEAGIPWLSRPSLLVAALALASTMGCSQEAGQPGVSGAEAEKPAEGEAMLEDRVDAVFQEWDRDDTPGCAAGAIQDGELVHSGGYGVADLEEGRPLDDESVFYLASVTKQFTSGVVADLALEGELDLDDSLAEWFPELPDWARDVRIRQTANNVSGIRDYLDLMRVAGWDFADVYTADDILGLIARQQDLSFDAGERYLYSNANFFLQALLVERATGESLRDYAHQRFFEPLGMDLTHFHDDHTEPVTNRVLSYEPAGEENGSSGSGRDFELSYMENTDWIGAGAGNLHTTIRDLARWEAHIQDLEEEGDPWIEKVRTPGVTLDGDTVDYAFGTRLAHWNELATVGHGGGWMGFRNHYLRFPEQRFAVAVLCNLGTVNPAELAREVAAIYLKEKIHRALEPFEGLYRSADVDGAEYRVVAEDGGLVLERLREGDRTELQPTGEPSKYEGTWDYDGDTRSMDVVFESPSPGEEGDAPAPALEVSTGRAWDVRFERVEGP